MNTAKCKNCENNKKYLEKKCEDRYCSGCGSKLLVSVKKDGHCGFCGEIVFTKEASCPNRSKNFASEFLRLISGKDQCDYPTGVSHVEDIDGPPIQQTDTSAIK